MFFVHFVEEYFVFHGKLSKIPEIDLESNSGNGYNPPTLGGKSPSAEQNRETDFPDFA